MAPELMTDEQLSDALTTLIAEHKARQLLLKPGYDWWESGTSPVLDEYKRRHARPKVQERRR